MWKRKPATTETKMTDSLGQEVRVRGTADNGVVLIAYSSDEEFQGLLQRVGVDLPY